jgi:hypothetical protein
MTMPNPRRRWFRPLIGGLLVVHAVVALVFLGWTRHAPYYFPYGDTLQGWPFPIWLNQGDAPLAHFSFMAILCDVAFSVVCTAPVSVLVIGLWRWRRKGDRSAQ